jgi:hypothetical protein
MSATFLVVDIQNRALLRAGSEEEFKKFIAPLKSYFGFRIQDTGKKPFPFQIATWRDIEGHNWLGKGSQETLSLAEARCLIDAYTDQLNEALAQANWVKGEYNKMAREQGLTTA